MSEEKSPFQRRVEAFEDNLEEAMRELMEATFTSDIASGEMTADDRDQLDTELIELIRLWRRLHPLEDELGERSEG